MRNKISQTVRFGRSETPVKMHTKRVWNRSKLSNCENTRTKQQSRIIILVAIYRFLKNSHTKRPSHKHCEGEIRKKLEKICEKPATDQRAQNATPVEETPPRPQNATPVEETLRKRLNATPVEETHQRAQNAIPVEETRCKRSNATPVEETLPGYSQDDFCRRNHTCVLRIRALSHKLYLSFQNAKCCRYRIGNDHRVCNPCFTCEILQKSHWEQT